MTEKQKRQGLRMSVKKAVDAVNLLKDEPDSPQKRESLFRKGILLTSYLAKLEAFDNSVFETLTDEEDLELEISNSRQFNETVEQAITETHPTTIQRANISDPLGFDNPHPSGSPNQVKIHLPKLEIPPFKGDPIQWQEFWDAFKAAIHDRRDLATINKFTYLRGLLEGEALRLIEGFRVTEANYSEVVEVLSQRYGDKQSVVFAHIDALLSMPPASGEAASLVNTHTKLERHLRSLDSLQPDQGMILYSVILSKLPRFLKIEVHRQKMAQADWSLSELRSWLKDEIHAREMGDRLHRLNTSTLAATEPSFKGGGAPREQVKNKKASGGSASALVTQSKEVQCPFCQGTHLAEDCTKFPDGDSRRSQLGNRCFVCLWKGHVAKNCRWKKPCKFCKRSGHHSCFCFTRFGKPKISNTTNLNVTSCSSAKKVSHGDSLGPPETSESSVLLTSSCKREQTIMQTALVHLVDNNGCTPATARLFFDTGASRSFITEAKHRELKLPAKRRELLSVSSFQSLKRQTREHKMVEFGVKCRDGSVQKMVAAVVPSITCPILKVPLSQQVVTVPEWALAEPLSLSSEYITIDVLVGMDYYYTFVSSQLVQGAENLWFLSSRVGYLASGRVPSSEAGAETVSVMLLDSRLTPGATETPAIDLSKYWDLEEIGISDESKQPTADEDALFSFSSTVRFGDGRYQVCWPWKTPTLQLKSNYGLALGRLRSLLTSLRKCPSLLKLYSDVIQSQLETGIIESAPVVCGHQRVYYIPHHCVSKPEHSTTKLRVVFDASSKASKNASSLNECLHRGPVMLEDLCGLLLRFRTFPVALVSDIEKAFLQIALQETERDVTRFFWVRDTSRPPEGNNLVTYRFCRVPFGVISSPFLLAATVSHHLKMSGSSIANQILKDLYVDNVITGSESHSDSVQFYLSAKKLFAEASMNLREWYSNSGQVVAVIPEIDRGKQIETKVLGLRWNTQGDTLCLTGLKMVDETPIVTKRRVLKTLAQVFDPCGFFAPVIISGKLLLQDLWTMNINWDDQVPNNLGKIWRERVLPSLTQVGTISISRHIGTSLTDDAQLHVFCDASIRACAAVVYLRSAPCASASVKVSLLMAKTRLAPVKQKATTPRLELVAVVLGTRLLEFVAKHIRLSVSTKFVWTDSQCVLHWLRKENVTERFVENRLKQIRKFKDVHFKYAPSAENPADLPTRGCTTEALVGNNQWWHGPQWLSEAEEEWPSMFSAATVSETVSEDSQVEPMLPIDQSSQSERLIDDKRFSVLQHLLRVTAHVLRFAHNIRSSPAEQRRSNLLVEEVVLARQWWIKTVQKEFFEDCISADGTPSGKISRQLGLFLDKDGLIRCSGRIQFAHMTDDAKHPVLLPHTDHFTALLIGFCHEQMMHAGVASTLAKVREKFWVVKGRTAVKRVIRNCRVCRRFDGGPFRTPDVPPLPEFRLEEGSAFKGTGIDYLGPLFIRLFGTDEAKKVWILLFTCAATRAVHLEVTEDMSTDQLMLALRRFIALHGAPALLVSDNGKQFRTASRTFENWSQKLRDCDEFRNLALCQSIKWRFITEMAPWMGGFYERLVGVVKQALRKSLSGVQVTLAELQTVVAEIVVVVNSRPLVYVEDDVGSVALSPMHLLSPLRRDGFVFSPDSSNEYNAPVVVEKLTRLWRRLQAIAAKFWRSWKSEYLVSLRERHSSHGQRGSSPWSPQIGTVVHLKQDLPRANWRLGRIEKCYLSADGSCRTVSVRLGNGKVVRRPLKLVYPLELDVSGPSAIGRPPGEPPSPQRPLRAAAIRARQIWKRQYRYTSDEE